MREGWEIRKLGDFSSIKSGKAIDAGEISSTQSKGLFPCYGGNGIRGYVKQTIGYGVMPIIGRVGALCGNVQITNGHFYATEHALIVNIKDASIYPHWYKYALTSMNLRQYAKGVAQPVLAARELEKLSIPVPPVQEQEKIVAELDCLTGIIEKKKQQLKELDNLAQSIFYDMFGDPITNEKGWEQLPFEQSIQKVKYTRKLQTKDFLEEGQYPIISQEEDYISGYWNDVKDVFHIPAPVVIFGDHTRVLKYVDFDFVLGADGVRVLLPIKAILPRFLFSYLKASKIPSLGYSRHYKLLKEMMVSVPPFDLQIHFTDKIEVIEKQKELIKKSIQETETLFNSRMDYWFN